MRRTTRTARTAPGGKKILSTGDALALMILTAITAVITTMATVSHIVTVSTGPATLTLSLATANQIPTGLPDGVEAYFTTIEATIPTLPSTEAALLAWAGALNQIGVLAVLALLFLLAFRLRRENLFTTESVWIIGVCGAVLAVAGTTGQILDQIARSRLAEAIGANKRIPGGTIIFAGDLPLAPAVAGIVLILVAGVFQFGRRLQKDTEGLV
ncbi:hypothetical protein ACX80I_17110 [Arthrobacter sp. MDT3-44]